jgi:FtsP/CotA-like multicopper oxidase with cupredoxin domain
MERRDFLKVTGAGLASTVVGSGMLTWATRSEAATISINLTAVKGAMTLIDGTTTQLFSYSSSTTPMVPGPLIVCQEGDIVEVTLNNTLATPVNFVLGRTSVALSVAPGATNLVSFAAPAAGTYLYYDDQNSGVNRIMGLHGALVVMPTGIKNQSFVGSLTFVRQYAWMISNVDTAWASQVKANGDAYVSSIVSTTFMPRYFLLNGKSFQSTEEPNTALAGNYDEACLVRILNAGGMVHSPHFHANHVNIISYNGTNTTTGRLKDVVSMLPLDVKDVRYPFKTPPDAYPVATGTQVYPMHCHSEMSQTAGGGLYPHGLHTAITYGASPATESDLQIAVAALP